MLKDLKDDPEQACELTERCRLPIVIQSVSVLGWDLQTCVKLQVSHEKILTVYVPERDREL